MVAGSTIDGSLIERGQWSGWISDAVRAEDEAALSSGSALGPLTLFLALPFAPAWTSSCAMSALRLCSAVK